MGHYSGVADLSAAMASEINTEGSAPRNALNAAIAEPGISTTYRSSTDPLADTLRSRYVSYQKQEQENGWNGGEPVWFDTAPLAKNMLTWRIPMEGWATRKVLPAHAGPFAESAWQRVVWAGAHWFAQDQPDDANPTWIHGHWSVETPVPSGQLHTRFQIFFNDRTDPSKVGSEVALISTNRADFLVDRQVTPGGVEGGRFILSGSHSLDRMVEFNRSVGDGPSGGGDKTAARRWAAGITGGTETGNNAGGNFAIRRHDDNGNVLGTSLLIKRDNGRITLGSDAWAPASQPATVMVTSPGAGVSGILVSPSANLAGGAAFNARLRAWDDTLLRSQIGSALPRFEITAFGDIKWMDGAGGTLGTLAVVNGALRYTGSSGTVTTIAPA